MNDNLYIIIVTYNGMSWLKKCIESCNNYSVIIIDNNSTDATVSFIETNYPKIKLFKQSRNLGFGQANNIGISYALSQGADYVFLLNQDAYLNKNTIEELISVHQRYKEYGILSPIHLNGNGLKLDRNFSHSLAYDNNSQFYFDAIKTSLKDIYEVPFVNAAAWLLPISTLEAIGGFDPIFFHYGEDDNYCQRIVFHNLKIGIVPETFVCHDREFRPKSKTMSLDEKNQQKKRLLLVKWTNINNEINDDIRIYKKNIKKHIFKSILKLKINEAHLYVGELKWVKMIEPKIEKSRLLNSQRENYLHLE